MIQCILCCSIFFNSLSCHEGFEKNTLIKTPYGYSAIKDILLQDTASCHNFENTHTTQKSVQNILYNTENSYVKITIESETILTSSENFFIFP